MSDETEPCSETNQKSDPILNTQSLVSPSTEKAVQDIIKTEIKTDKSLVASNSESVQLAATEEPVKKQNDDFENLQRAVQILATAKHLDDSKRYDEALKKYRQGIDILLEELIERPGTDQSRTYLREKCNHFMNRIDQLKLIIQIENANAANAANKENQSQVQS